MLAPWRGVAQFGSAFGSGPKGRGFESRHFDHLNHPNRVVFDLYGMSCSPYCKKITPNYNKGIIRVKTRIHVRSGGFPRQTHWLKLDKGPRPPVSAVVRVCPGQGRTFQFGRFARPFGPALRPFIHLSCPFVATGSDIFCESRIVPRRLKPRALQINMTQPLRQII